MLSPEHRGLQGLPPPVVHEMRARPLEPGDRARIASLVSEPFASSRIVSRVSFVMRSLFPNSVARENGFKRQVRAAGPTFIARRAGVKASPVTARAPPWNRRAPAMTPRGRLRHPANRAQGGKLCRGTSRFTAEGAKNIRDTVQRARQTREQTEKRGFKVQTLLWTQGPYDLVSIIDAPSEEAMMGAMANVVAAGNVSSTTMRAFDDKEMEGIQRQG